MSTSGLQGPGRHLEVLGPSLRPAAFAEVSSDTSAKFTAHTFSFTVLGYYVLCFFEFSGGRPGHRRVQQQGGRERERIGTDGLTGGHRGVGALRKQQAESSQLYVFNSILFPVRRCCAIPLNPTSQRRRPLRVLSEDAK